MRHRLNPGIESLETKNLLSHVAMGMPKQGHLARWEEMVRHRLNPRIESLETKNLLSRVAMGMIGPKLPGSVSGAFRTPTPPIGMPTPPIRMPIPPVRMPIPPIGMPTPPIGMPTPPIGMPTPPIGMPTPPIPSPVYSLATSITTNQTSYLPGQVVKMTFTVTNDTDKTVSVPIGPSIDGFWVTSDGKTVWSSTSGVEPDFIVLEKLAPGQSIILTAAWNATSSMSGTFVVHNQLDSNDSATFEIGVSPVVGPVATRA
jgi:hypothetical protein